MTTRFFTKNLNDEEKRSLENLVADKQDTIAAVLYTKSEVDLLTKGIADTHHVYRVEFHILVDGETVLAQETGHSLKEAFDRALGDLLRVLRKRKTAKMNFRQKKQKLAEDIFTNPSET